MESKLIAAQRLFHIKCRQVSDLTFRTLRKAGKRISNQPDTVTDVLIYPAIKNKEELNEIINKLAWYLPPDVVTPHTIHIAANAKSTGPITGSPDSQPEYERNHLNINFIDSKEVPKKVSDSDLILCHNFYQSISKSILSNIGRVVIIDPDFYRATEVSEWIGGTTKLRRMPQHKSHKKFLSLEELAADYEDSFVFATGPSLEEAYSYEFPDDSLKIICNGIVRNKELMDHIDPDVLTFADPVKHFGPSEYAHDFRKNIASIVQNYDCMIAIPLSKYDILAGQYPDISEYIIGIEPVDSDIPRFPTHNSLDVMRTSNIMTSLMLPIASSLTNRVHIIGADGREGSESQIWEYSNAVQYDDMMRTAIDSHPSFFRDKRPEKLYRQHVQTLSDIIKYGEKQCLEYVSLTKSHIECLQERHGGV